MILVFSTCGSEEDAARIGHALVERRLAACVNVVPGVRSIYWWQGKIDDSQEALLVIKSKAELFDALSDAIRELHPYELPEVVAVDVTAGLPGYLAWVVAETRTA